MRSSRFRKNVLVLTIPDDQHPLPTTFTLYEFEPVIGGIDGDERDGTVVILSRCDGTFPLAKIECRYSALAPHLKFTQFPAGIALCQTSHQRLLGRNNEPFPFFCKGCLMACRLGGNVVGCFEFAVEDYFQQATAERTQQ